MKKSVLIPLTIAVAVLAVFTFYLFSLTFWGPASGNQQFCPFCSPSQTRSEVNRGRGMGPGMMGRGTMMGTEVNSEFDFLIHMIPHHEEAVSTAIILRDNTERAEMKLFAEDIIRTQSEEVELMKSWLEAWYPEKDHEAEYRPMMRELQGLESDELDRVFLEDMIIHHMEAVMMSQQLIRQNLAENEAVEELAESIRNTQRNEIHMMRNWLFNL